MTQGEVLADYPDLEAEDILAVRPMPGGRPPTGRRAGAPARRASVPEAGVCLDHRGRRARQAELVVLPAFVENRPRRLLEMLASGVPVIATPACGLGPREGLTLVPTGDVTTQRERTGIEPIP
jgi:hypothetical protein